MIILITGTVTSEHNAESDKTAQAEPNLHCMPFLQHILIALLLDKTDSSRV